MTSKHWLLSVVFKVQSYLRSSGVNAYEVESPQEPRILESLPPRLTVTAVIMD